jgi:hypothetical protein
MLFSALWKGLLRIRAGTKRTLPRLWSAFSLAVKIALVIGGLTGGWLAWLQLRAYYEQEPQPSVHILRFSAYATVLGQTEWRAALAVVINVSNPSPHPMRIDTVQLRTITEAGHSVSSMRPDLMLDESLGRRRRDQDWEPMREIRVLGESWGRFRLLWDLTDDLDGGSADWVTDVRRRILTDQDKEGTEHFLRMLKIVAVDDRNRQYTTRDFFTVPFIPGFRIDDAWTYLPHTGEPFGLGFVVVSTLDMPSGENKTVNVNSWDFVLPSRAWDLEAIMRGR